MDREEWARTAWQSERGRDEERMKTEGEKQRARRGKRGTSSES